MIYIKEYPSQARLKELFDYVDGHLVWKIRQRSDFQTSQSHCAFNSKLAGTVVGNTKNNGYGVVTISHIQYFVHRLVWIWHNGDLDPSQEIDHRDQNPENYAINNLRIADRLKNNVNRGAQSNSKTGIKGVCWDESRKKWHAYIKSGETYIRKRFVEFDDAVAFVRRLREELHGEFHNHGD